MRRRSREGGDRNMQHQQEQEEDTEAEEEIVLYRCSLPPLSHLPDRTRGRILARLDRLSRLSRPNKQRRRSLGGEIGP